MSTTTTVLQALEADAAAGEAWVKHAAMWLIGASIAAKTDLAALEASNPLVDAAITAGIGAAKQHGIPVDQITKTADEVLAVAQVIAGTTAPVASTTQGGSAASATS